jgi:hypothetical protein
MRIGPAEVVPACGRATEAMCFDPLKGSAPVTAAPADVVEVAVASACPIEPGEYRLVLRGIRRAESPDMGVVQLTEAGGASSAVIPAGFLVGQAELTIVGYPEVRCRDTNASCLPTVRGVVIDIRA